MSKSAIRSIIMRHPTLLRLQEEVFDPEMETILHPSSLRLKSLGFFTIIGHPLFWYLWTVLSPQPYENLTIRLVLACMGLGFFFRFPLNGLPSVWTRRYFAIVCWFQLPVFFTWMYWMNGGNTVWLVTAVTIVLLYYNLTDWRLATIGVLTGIPIATQIAYWHLGTLPSIRIDDLIAIVFAFLVAIALAVSSANLRREKVRQSLIVIGVLAHEMRTPLSTLSLLGQAIMNEAANKTDDARTKGLTRLATKLETLTRTLNHQLELQMINARFMQLPRVNQLISATGLINTVVTQYPFSSKKEEDCVEIIVHEDFWFMGSERHFKQVLNNLLKNALFSLKAAQSRLNLGDLRIELGKKYSLGRISISDKGMGIKPEHIQRIFEPFFSTNQDTGHGLGLAFCKQVVQNSGGIISVTSEADIGATFSIDLPIKNITLAE